jgi:hypothetical protein
VGWEVGEVEVVAIDQFDIDVKVVVDQRQYKPINIYITKVSKKNFKYRIKSRITIAYQCGLFRTAPCTS